MRKNLDQKLWKSSVLFCGVDEAGRGALAGPVVAAAVILHRHTLLAGVRDSKLLTPRHRTELAFQIRQKALAWALGSASHRCIDRRNILEATFSAMCIAINRLPVRPGLVLVDGCGIPDVGIECRAIVRGDNRSMSIACASILAKVYRDTLMERFDSFFPGYGFSRNKGYGTREHLQALRRLGPSPIHRRTFAPVRSALGQACTPVDALRT